MNLSPTHGPPCDGRPCGAAAGPLLLGDGRRRPPLPIRASFPTPRGEGFVATARGHRPSRRLRRLVRRGDRRSAGPVAPPVSCSLSSSGPIASGSHALSRRVGAKILSPRLHRRAAAFRRARAGRRLQEGAARTCAQAEIIPGPARSRADAGAHDTARRPGDPRRRGPADPGSAASRPPVAAALSTRLAALAAGGLAGERVARHFDLLLPPRQGDQDQVGLIPARSASSTCPARSFVPGAFARASPAGASSWSTTF